MSYAQFCPIAKAAEVISEKWSIVILRELIVGTDTFSGLRNFIPLISPTLLSRRLVEFEDAGILKKVETGHAKPKYSYKLTPAGEELKPVIFSLGEWGNRWAVSNLNKKDYDPRLLMWDIKRNIKMSAFEGIKRYVIEFNCSGVPRQLSRWWFVIESRTIPDICHKHPGHEINLFVRSDIKTLVDTWMGWKPLRAALNSQKIVLEGLNKDVSLFTKWYGLNYFTRSQKSP